MIDDVRVFLKVRSKIIRERVRCNIEYPVFHAIKNATGYVYRKLLWDIKMACHIRVNRPGVDTENG